MSVGGYVRTGPSPGPNGMMPWVWGMRRDVPVVLRAAGRHGPGAHVPSCNISSPGDSHMGRAVAAIPSPLLSPLASQVMWHEAVLGVWDGLERFTIETTERNVQAEREKTREARMKQ